MTDLRTRLLAEIERREAAVNAALAEAPGNWRAGHHSEVTYCVEAYDGGPDTEIMVTGSLADAAFIALHGPDDALRRYSHYRHILHIHVPTHGARPEEGYDAPTCAGCGRDDIGDPRHLVPCPELRALAEALGIPIEEPTGDE